MNNGQVFDERREYVESFNNTLSTLEDFDYIKYARSYVTEQEYIKIADNFGGCVFLDITAMKLSNILKEIAVVVLGKVPKSCITQTETKRKIAPLFK